MRRKVANTIDAELYERAQQFARRQGKRINEVIEDALKLYLEQAGRRRSVVRESAGVFRVPREAVQALVEADLYGEVE